MNNGKLLLRIDDMDEQRCRPAYVTDIFDCLSFLDLGYDEGPRNPQELASEFSQMKRWHSYENALNKLVALNLVYACTCSRKEIEMMPGKVCPRNCRNYNIPLDTPQAAWRIKMDGEVNMHFIDQLLGDVEIDLQREKRDFIVKQKNGLPAYQLCSLVDDVHFSITHIVRGSDLLVSTAAQLFLADLLSENNFKQTHFLHHPLITNHLGKKLSKSAGDISVKEMRNLKMDKVEVFRKITANLNVPDKAISSPNELLEIMHGKRIEELFG